jgi:4-coumarate--CoA ligase
MTHDILKPHWSRFLGPNAPDPHKFKYKPHNDPIFASPFGPFPPSPDDLNIHELCFPPNNPLPPDFPLFINAVTNETLSLHHFYARTCALARVFRHDGPNPLNIGASPANDQEDGEILGLFSRNHIHYPMVAHACFRAELVFGGISPASTPYELWWVLRKMQITSIMCHETLLPVLHAALELGAGDDDELPLKLVLDQKKIVVLSEDARRDHVDGYRTIESLVRQGTQLPERPRKLRGGNRMAYLFQSSGTSGLPKAMMITHRNGYHSGIQTLITAVQSALYMNMEPLAPSVVLGVVPMYHSYGMIIWILRINLVRNATTILLPKWDLELALQSIQTHKITTLPLVPPLVRAIAQSPLTAKYNLSSVTAAVSGAAYLPPAVAHQLATKLPQGASAPIPSGYGLSEAASIASPAAPGLFGLPAAPPGSVGYLLPGMEARIVDPNTLLAVPPGAPGELWTRGAVVTPGYFKDAAATAALFAEPGWLRTGDLVRRDANDCIHYLDRLKEMIKVKGLQVAATEVEDVLLAHPEKLVRDACVAGVDSSGGEGDGGELRVRAWVVVTPAGQSAGENTVASKLDTWVRERLSRHKWLTGGVEVVDEVCCARPLSELQCNGTDSGTYVDPADAVGQDAAARDARSVSFACQGGGAAGEALGR